MQKAAESIEVLIEALLLAANEPLDTKFLARLVDAQVNEVDSAIRVLSLRWQNRGLILQQVASGWRFQTKADIRKTIDLLDLPRPPKYSRAVMECLAIIAYRQPVTRGDIEHIRGVPVSSSTIKTLEERGWIESIGHRETPGRPELFGTTKRFLDDLGLSSLEMLPNMEIASEDLFSNLQTEPSSIN